MAIRVRIIRMVDLVERFSVLPFLARLSAVFITGCVPFVPVPPMGLQATPMALGVLGFLLRRSAACVLVPVELRNQI